jgi:hypothetical protein
MTNKELKDLLSLYEDDIEVVYLVTEAQATLGPDLEVRIPISEASFSKHSDKIEIS